MKTYIIPLLIFFNSLINSQGLNEATEILPITREFRGAWVATVANINWPSEPGLPEQKQKEEALYLLDLLKKNNYNAVIFQVRPQADALYKSNLEPWSYFLTGQQGIAPDDFYDPLQFWIEEAHKRSLELHAWINPYRAHHKMGNEISEYSLVKTKPELVLKLKEGYWWFDPSIEETQDHLFTVVMDIARRYDVDGIHFDDYFYPYPSYNDNIDFPDSTSWNNYLEGGGILSRADWRRESVNKLIKRLYTNLKLMKPHVKFGISPFGIWRPNNPISITGFDQYDKLYADAKLWLNKGWIDYFVPQLYWTTDDIEQSFPILLNWWKEQNYQNRFLWTGINAFHGVQETINQIMITRGMINSNTGNIHWSIAPLVEDSLMSVKLLEGPYRSPALVPALSWHNKYIPNEPEYNMKLENDSLSIKIDSAKLKGIRNWIIYFNYDKEWGYDIKSIDDPNHKIPLRRVGLNHQDSIVVLSKIGVSIVDKYSNESKIKVKSIK